MRPALFAALAALGAFAALHVSPSAAQERPPVRRKGGDVDKAKPKPRPTPVQHALNRLPKVDPGPLERGSTNRAIGQHLLRIKRAKTRLEEARAIEAFVAWCRRTKGEHFEVTLGHRCSPLTDEDLLALSKWTMAKLMLNGAIDQPRIEWVEVTFKDPRNVLRLVPALHEAQRKG